MAKLDNFSGLTRPQEDLLKKYYCFGSLALLNLNLSRDNFTFHTRVSERQGQQSRASAWLQYKTDLFLLKAKRRNDRLSHYKLEVTPQKFIPNFKAVFECKLEEGKEVDSSANFEYSHEKVKGKLSYLTASKTLRLQGTAGKAENGFGLDTKVNTESWTVSSHVEALWLFKNSARLVLKHVGKDLASIGSFEASYLHAVNNSANIGSKVTSDWQSRKTSLEVGGDFAYDSSTWVKGKVNSDGKLALALTRLVANNLRTSVATEVTVASLLSNNSDSFKLGVRVDFSD
jgi:hypothetical protein